MRYVLDASVAVAALRSHEAGRPALLKEAQEALGKEREHAAGHVMQQFLGAMKEGTMTFPGEPGTGMSWMKRIVGEIARG